MGDRSDLPEMRAATQRLLRSLAGLTDGDLPAPSRCPGWSRGHVLAHLARNADGLTRLVQWAADGQERPQYPSAQAREADIAAGSTRPLAEQVADLEASAQRLDAAFAGLREQQWENKVRAGVAAQGPRMPAKELPWRRLLELEIHHVDLDLPAYTPAHWPAEFVQRLLEHSARRLDRNPEAPALQVAADDLGVSAQAGTGGPTVHGPGAALAAWLTGRGTGEGLSVDPDGQLPRLPPWG